jgi:hypothetical protein
MLSQKIRELNGNLARCDVWLPQVASQRDNQPQDLRAAADSARVGTSTQPAYRGGGLTFANRLALAWRQPARGAVPSASHDTPWALSRSR